jgi:outer membrane protein assembly factor BamE (lipoprotein component of BamABCDE complex)
MENSVSPGRSVIVYLLLAIILLGSAQLTFFLIGCQQDKQPQTDQTQEREVYTRDEFKQLILGKTEDEVLQALGKPRSTSQKENVQYWHYANRTMDPLTKKIDSDAQVVLENGRVRAINY